MASNLARSGCCGNVVRLADLRGRPIEFRRSGPYAPQIGTRWDCPACDTAYFAFWRSYDRYWGEAERADSEGTWIGEQFHPNTERGRFVTETSSPLTGERRLEETGCFVIDLAYYATGRDEAYGEDLTHTSGREPGRLCTDDAADVQWIWGEAADTPSTSPSA